MLEQQLRVYMKPRGEAEGKKGNEGEGDGEREAQMLTGNGIDFRETSKPTLSDSSTNKAILPNPFQTVPSTVNETFRYISLWVQYSFKSPVTASKNHILTCIYGLIIYFVFRVMN